jgi:hypothetical protein
VSARLGKPIVDFIRDQELPPSCAWFVVVIDPSQDEAPFVAGSHSPQDTAAFMRHMAVKLAGEA